MKIISTSTSTSTTGVTDASSSESIDIIDSLSNARITSTIDFTTSEPAHSAGTTYINSVTGTGSTTTGTTFTANYLYRSDGSSWIEIVPYSGLSLYHIQQGNIVTYSGVDWPVVAMYDPTDTRIEYNTGSLITVPHSSTLDMNGGGFTIIYSFQPAVLTGTQYICNKESGGVGWGIYMVDNDIYCRYDDGTNDDSGLNAINAVTTGVMDTYATAFKPYHGAGLIYTLRTYHSHYGGIRIQVYWDFITPVNAGDVDSASNLYIGSNSSGSQNITGNFTRYMVLNYALTPMCTTSVMTQLDGGVFVDSVDNSEMLNEGDFTTTTKWSATGDWTLGSGVATLAWTGDGTSTLTQTSANMVSPIPAISAYILKYDVTTTQTTGTLTLTVTPGSVNYSDSQPFGNTSVEMDITTGSYEILFMAMAASSSDFVITAVSSGGAVGDSTVIDNLSLRRAGAILNLGPDSLVA